jgi:hypothetical protein
MLRARARRAIQRRMARAEGAYPLHSLPQPAHASINFACQCWSRLRLATGAIPSAQLVRPILQGIALSETNWSFILNARRGRFEH